MDLTKSTQAVEHDNESNSCLFMAVEVHIYLIDVQSRRTSIQVSYFGYRINTICGKITSLFLLVVRSIVCSTYFYREVDIRAGQLGCHRRNQGMLP